MQGYTYFLMFAPKHRLWVLVRKYQNFSAKIFQFLKLQNSLYIAWACFRNASVQQTLRSPNTHEPLHTTCYIDDLYPQAAGIVYYWKC